MTATSRSRKNAAAAAAPEHRSRNRTIPRGRAEIIARALEFTARRIVLGWSQNDFARRVGRNGGTVSRIMRATLGFTSAPFWRKGESVLRTAERRRGIPRYFVTTLPQPEPPHIEQLRRALNGLT